MINITSLIGHSQIEVGCHCLGSLWRHCQDEIRFTIHDDGSLTPQDKEKLQRTLANPTFVDRKTADEHVLPILQKYPACLKYRGDFTMGLKMFDIYLMQPADEPLLFCDSDVLFLRPFRFPPPISKDMAVYMQDSQQASSVRAWDLKPVGSFEIIRKLNSGLINIYAHNFDLHRVEAIFTDPKLEWIFRQRHQWIEQTVLAMLATDLTTYFYSPKQVVLAQEKMSDVAKEQVAIHFVSSFRHNLAHFLDYQPETGAVAVDLKLEKARNASVLGVLAGDVRKRLKR